MVGISSAAVSPSPFISASISVSERPLEENEKELLALLLSLRRPPKVSKEELLLLLLALGRPP